MDARTFEVARSGLFELEHRDSPVFHSDFGNHSGRDKSRFTDDLKRKKKEIKEVEKRNSQ